MGRKRRPQGAGSIYKRKSDGRWVVEITIGKKDDGKPKKEYYYFSSEKEAHNKLAEIQYKKNIGEYIEVEKITVSEWIDKWLWDVKREELKPRTFDSYEQTARLYIKPYIGDMRLQELLPMNIDVMLNKLKNKGLSSRIQKYAQTILKAALEYAVSNKIVNSNACKHSKKITVERVKPMIIFTREERDRFLEVIKGHRYEAAYIVAITTGVRLGELLAINWECVNLLGKDLIIERNLQRVRTFTDKEFKSELIFGSPKTRKGIRTIPLLEITVESLSKHQFIQNEQKQKMGELYEDNNLVFCTDIGRPIDPKNLTRNFKKVLKDAKLPDINFHAIRHIFATMALESDISMKALQELLGHSTITTTFDTYAKVTPEYKSDEMDKLKALF